MDRYNNIKQLRNQNSNVGTIGDLYYRDVNYPSVEARESDIYVETEWGDRLDSLAFQFYGDVTLYWIIAIANPNTVGFGTLFPKRGTQLRIPIDISSIVDAYNRLNEL